MDDPRLEARLRDDPTNDRQHVAGRFRDRLARTATARPRRAPAPRAQGSFGVLVAAALVIAVALAFRGGTFDGSGAAPTTPASPSPALSQARFDQVVDEWARANGEPSVTVTVIGSTGVRRTAVHGPDAAPPSIDAEVRIGEVSRVYLAAAAVALEACSRGLGYIACPAPTPIGAFRLDDAVARWLPTWPSADATTVRHLLEGSSGLAPVGPTIADLRAEIAADPSADWSRASVIARAVSEPRRFPPGARRDPVDTEAMLLEDVLDRATGLPSGLWVEDVNAHGHGLLGQQPSRAVPRALIRGTLAAGGTIADLEPDLVAILRDQGAVAASSGDLAYLAASAWGTSIAQDASSIAYLTDAAGGHRSPLGAAGLCPCEGNDRTVIAQTGHSVAWSAVAAYDFGASAAVGIVVDRDLSEVALRDLVQRLVSAIRA